MQEAGTYSTNTRSPNKGAPSDQRKPMQPLSQNRLHGMQPVTQSYDNGKQAINSGVNLLQAHRQAQIEDE